MSNFFKDIISSDDIRNDLELNPTKVLSSYGINVSKENIPSVIKLPSKETLQLKTRELLSAEQFSFPTRLNAQAGLPLAFAITIVFVFIPSRFVELDSDI